MACLWLYEVVAAPGGPVRAALGWLDQPSLLMPATLVIKATLLLLPVLAAAQWALHCLQLFQRLKKEGQREGKPRQLRTGELLVPVLRRRLALSVLIFSAVAALVVLFATFELNAVNSSLGNFLIVALAGCLFESLLSTYDVRGRFAVHRIGAEEAKFKLCRVKALEMGKNKIPYVVTHDGRTVPYPDPMVKVNDTIKFDVELNKMTDFVKFETGNLAMISGGKNTGRVGVIVSRERHQGSYDIVHVKDSQGHTFATRLGNVFVIGEGQTPLISLPKRKGIKMTIMEERSARTPK